jgi:hypothetical protein
MEHGSVCCSACQKRFEVSSEGSLSINKGNAHFDNEVSLSRMSTVAM